MDTTTAQPVSSNQPQLDPVQDSYADAYVPPTDHQSADGQTPAETLPNESAGIDQSMIDQPLPDDVPSTGEPQAEPTADPAPPSVVAPAAPSEELADQNIFEMLGVTTGTPEQREQFLDELQQVIWEDFIEHDTKLLLTESEQAELQTIVQAAPDKSLEQQEQVVVFLEKLIPDLEDIMLEKALQLKEEMARERLKALRELHRNDTDQLATIDRAEQLMGQQQWRSASEALNSVG